MADAVAAGAAVATAAAPSLKYLDDKFNALIRRHDLLSDNQQRLQRVQQLVRVSLTYSDRWLEQHATDCIVGLNWRTWRLRLQHVSDDCQQIASSVQRATFFSRVQRANDILEAGEKLVRQFLDFAAVEEEAITSIHPAQCTSQSKPSFEATGSVPVNPPRLTLHYNSPHTFEGKLKTAVLEHSTRKILAVVASGRGGVGKTCALRGLADDTHVKLRFPDGVQFIKLGKDAGTNTLIQKIACIVDRTGDLNRANRIRGCTQLQDAVDEASVWFGARKCLFLVDDVWRQNGIDGGAFYVLADMINAGSRLVYTTRDSDLALKADKFIQFEPRTREESQIMFLKHAGLEQSTIGRERNKEALQAILNICAGIPLLLAVTGAGVRQCSGRVRGPKENGLSVYHAKLKRNPQALYGEKFEGYGPVSDVVDTSISVLESSWNSGKEPGNFPISIREMFQSLCVLKKQQDVPVSMLQRLWCLNEKERAVEVMDALNDVAVVEVVIMDSEDCDLLKSALRVHDDILDLLLVRAADEKRKYFERLLNNYEVGIEAENGTEPERLPVKAESGERRKSAVCWHLRRFRCCWRVENDETDAGKELQAKGNTEQSARGEIRRREWWKLEDDDGYAEDNICRLLREAEQFEELVWLLLKPQWIVKRLRDGGMFAVEQDISVGIGVVGRTDIERKEEITRSLEVIAHAARLSHHAVAENAREAWFQLYGRLLHHSEKCDTSRQFIEEVAENAERPWVKPGKGILTAAGGVELGRISVGGVVQCIVNTDNVVKICSFDYCRQQMQITTFNLKYGSRSTVSIPAFSVRCTALSGDGTVAVGSSYGKLRRWDAVSGEEKDGQYSSEQFECVSSSGDGNRIAFGTENALVLWEIEKGNVAYELFKAHWVTCVAVSANGTKVVCGSNKGNIWIWNAANEAVCEIEKGHSGCVNCLAFSGTGDLIASGSDDGFVCIWSAEDGAAVVNADFGYVVKCVAFVADGGVLVVGSYGSFGVWQRSGGVSMARRFCGYVGLHPECVSVSVDGTVAFFGGQSAVELQDLRRWRIDIDTDAGGSDKWFTEDTLVLQMQELTIGRSDHALDAEEVDDGSSGNTPVLPMQELTIGSSDHAHDAEEVDDSSSDNTLVTPMQELGSSSRDHGRYQADLDDWMSDNSSLLPIQGRLIGIRDDRMQRITSHEVSADGRWVATGSLNGAVCLWDTGRAAEQPYELGSHLFGVTGVALSEDARRVVSGSRDGSVCVWDVERRAAKFSTGNRGGEVRVAISADGTHVAYCSSLNVLRVWQLPRTAKARDRMEARITKMHHVDVVAISADCARVAAACGNELQVLAVHSGAVTYQFLVFSWNICRVLFGRDGRSVVAVADDNRYGRKRACRSHLFEFDSGRCVATSECAAWEALVSSVSFWPPVQQPLPSFAIDCAHGALVLGTPDNGATVYRSKFGFFQVAHGATRSSVGLCQLVH